MSHLDTSSVVSPRDSIIAGGAAGLLARFIVAPIDLLKIRLQLNTNPHVFGNTFSTLKEIYQQEGFRAFWKGNTAAECLYMSYSALQFVSLNYVNQQLLDFEATKWLSEPARQFVAGSFSGAFTTVCTYPFDIVRTRVAASKAKESALRPILRKTWQNEGILGFYKGIFPYVFSIFPYMGSFFGIYSFMRDVLDKQTFRWLPDVISASAIAGALSKTLVFPLDTIRKRTQAHGILIYGSSSKGAGKTFEYSHKFWACASQILGKEGPKGFYRGLGIAIVKSVPGSALTMLFYEEALRLLEATR